MAVLARIRDVLLGGLVLLGALAILTLMLHVGLDVVLRNVLNQPIPATYEIVTNYYMIALAFVPLAWVERGGGMVQVEVIDGLLSARMIRISDRIVALFSTLIYSALAWVTLASALRNWSAGTFVMAQTVAVPTWPAYFLVPLGFGLAALATLIRAVGAGPVAE